MQCAIIYSVILGIIRVDTGGLFSLLKILILSTFHVAATAGKKRMTRLLFFVFQLLFVCIAVWEKSDRTS